MFLAPVPMLAVFVPLALCMGLAVGALEAFAATALLAS
jgi:hypothetical protein